MEVYVEVYGRPCAGCSSVLTDIIVGVAAIGWECLECGHHETVATVPVPIEEEK